MFWLQENLILIKKMSKKCSTAQRFIRTEMTTYRIGTLAHYSKKIQFLYSLSFFSICCFFNELFFGSTSRRLDFIHNGWKISKNLRFYIFQPHFHHWKFRWKKKFVEKKFVEKTFVGKKKYEKKSERRLDFIHNGWKFSKNLSFYIFSSS